MAIDSIFLDSGVLRAYIDRRDRVHEKCFATIHDYLDLNSSFYTTTLNIAELSFWLDKSRSRYGKRMRGLEKMANTTSLEVCESMETDADVMFRDWLKFCQNFEISLDFTDFYFYQTALQNNSDYLMTTDRADFSVLLALAPSYPFATQPKRRKSFTHDNLIFI